MDDTQALMPTAGAEMTARPADLVREWHEHLDLEARAGQISTDTAQTYWRGLEKFRSWLRQNSQGDISKNAVLDWIAYLRVTPQKDKDRPVSPSTINVWLAGVKAFCQWAHSHGHIKVDPTLGVKAAARRGVNKSHKRDHLTDEEILRLLALEMSKRDRALIWLLAYTATRSIEIHRANIEDLQTKGGELVLFVQGKGKADSDEYVVIADSDARAAIYDYLAERGTSNGPLFATEYEYDDEPRRLSRRRLREIVKDNFIRAGIVSDKKTTHSLRHTALTNALRNGASLQATQAMARHANIATTMIYAHNLNRLSDAAEKHINYRKRES